MARSNMTYRVVPLRSAEAGDARLGESADERLEMVRELSRAAWAATGRPLPVYDRATMPVRVLSLTDLGRRTGS